MRLLAKAAAAACLVLLSACATKPAPPPEVTAPPVAIPVLKPVPTPPPSPAGRNAVETGVTLATPRIPLVANVLASEVTNPADIKRRLVEQVTAMVRWRESVQYMKSAGVDTLVECGTGKVLSGLVKRIDREMTGIALNTPADIEAFLKTV